jgi:DNA-binding transcriptional LysR family regulator
VELEELADRPLVLVPDTCGLTRFTTQLFGTHGLPVRRYPGEASSYQMLDEWARLGLGVSILPESRLANAESPLRPLKSGGEDVEIFYEAVWDPRSVLAEDLLTLAEALAARPRNGTPVAPGV